MEFRFRAKSGNKTFDEPSYVKCRRMSMWYHSFPGTQQTLTNGVASWQQTDPSTEIGLKLVLSIQGRKGIVTLTPKYACYYIDET